MSITVNKSSDIPAAPYYVLANDRFFSGWGPARDKVNTVIVPCDNYDFANFMEARLKTHGDMSRVRVVSNKPRMRNTVLYSLFTPESARAWFTADITLRMDSADYWRIVPEEAFRLGHYGIPGASAGNFWEAFNSACQMAQKYGINHLDLNWELGESLREKRDREFVKLVKSQE